MYAFCIITQSFTDPNGNWDLTFLIDGEQSGTFELAPDGDDTYRYNVPVYGNDSLTPGTHTFTMVVGHAGGQSSLALLDYMVFTYVSLNFVTLYVAHRGLGAAKKTARIRLPPRLPRLHHPPRPVCLVPLAHRQARPRPQSIRPRTAQQQRRSRCLSPSPQLRYSVSAERSSSAQDDATSANTRNALKLPRSTAAKLRATVRRRPQLASASCLSSPAHVHPRSTHNKLRIRSSCPHHHSLRPHDLPQTRRATRGCPKRAPTSR